MVHELVLKRLPAALDGECIEVTPVPQFDSADELLQKLLRRCPSQRLSAAAALLEPFLCQTSTSAPGAQGNSQMRLAVVRQEIRSLHNSNSWSNQAGWHRVVVERIPGGGLPSRDPSRQYVSVRSVLDTIKALTAHQLKKRLSVEFNGQEGEIGLDYGGLTSNMYREFWGIVLDPQSPTKSSEGSRPSKLPAEGSSCEDLKTVGKLMMKCLYGTVLLKALIVLHSTACVELP